MKKLTWLLILCLLLCGCAVQSPTQNEPTGDSTQTVSREDLVVHTIDVGQGDSIFIELPDKSTMLIDAGERTYGQWVEDYIRDLGYDRIDYLIGTHPHSDHIGGMQHIVENFEIGRVYLPKKSHTTATFRNLLQAIKDKGLSVQTALAGKNIVTGGDFSADILSPVSEDYGDNLNLYSVIVKITYGTQRFLFTGDAETENEEQLSDVAAEFIKVGHHGSNTSSSEDFVKRVGAKYAVVSVGSDNSYGLPKEHILQRWADSGAKVYRTDEVGSVIAYSDGKSITIEAGKTTQSTPVTPTPDTEPGAVEPALEYVLNISSKKIHLPDCPSVQSMSEKNKKRTDKTLQQLYAEGYTPCQSCDP